VSIAARCLGLVLVPMRLIGCMDTVQVLAVDGDQASFAVDVAIGELVVQKSWQW
jgi:hypothetical protein